MGSKPGDDDQVRELQRWRDLLVDASDLGGGTISKKRLPSSCAQLSVKSVGQVTLLPGVNLPRQIFCNGKGSLSGLETGLLRLRLAICLAMPGDRKWLCMPHPERCTEINSPSCER